jgi:nucleoside-diphosphate-sugar epimerase
MRVVMTGGGGFIGAHLLARMLGAGLRVTLIGSSTGKSRYTASLVAAGDVAFVQCDDSFYQSWLLRRTLEDADVLVLLGYVMPTSSSSPQRLIEELTLNVSPTVRLLRAAEGGPRHVVFASSVSVYGDTDSVPLRESDAPSPQTPYAVAKLTCERSIQVICAAGGWSASILRYSTVYGPGETVPRAIPNFIRAALAGHPPVVNGDGLDEHDYVHVADVVEATLAAIRRRTTGVYNVGTGIGTRTLDIAELAVNLTRASVRPMLRPVQRPSAAPVKIVCGTDLATAQLGFTARRPLVQGMTEEIGWFRSQLLYPAAPALAVSA